MERPVRDVRDTLFVARNTDGKLTRRPLSPHLQVYRWPISMALSISHRATGVGLGIGTLLLTWWLVALAVSDNAFSTVQGFLGSPIGILVLFVWSGLLVFHLVTGIRHLVWDAGYGFEKPDYNISGWTAVAVTAALTILIWIVGLVVW
jgi:succinate dehydrogenase / fumarate reductase cytochrome b subunit